MKKSMLLIFALFALTKAADNCEEGFSYCPVLNACYEPSQYTCSPDFFNGQNRLCGVGTVSCNDVCIAECAYRCDANGTYSVRPDRTCPPPPSCAPNQIGCGSACYDANLFCCVSGQPTDIKSCPTNDEEQFCHTSSSSVIVLPKVGSLHDGQLRLDYGPGAFNVNFTLCNGVITDDRGQTCYISESHQLQCNTAPQTEDYVGFCLEGDYLSYNGQNLWYECDVGTGGSNIYTQDIDALACTAVYLLVQETESDVPDGICIPTIETESTFSTSSTEEDATTSSTEEQATTSSTEEEATTSSTEATTSSTVAPSTTSSTVAPSTTSSTVAPSTTSSTVAPSTTSSTEATTSSTVAPSTTSSTVAPSTTSSTVAPSTTSSTKAASTTSSTVAPSTTSAVAPPCPTSSTKASTSSTKASTTSSTKSPSTTSIYTPSTYSAPPTSSACPPDWKSSGVYLPVPFLYYSFDYGLTSTKVRDDSNHGRDGKIVGNPSVVEGMYKNGLKFTGRGYQTIKVDSCSSLGKDFTIATWLKMNTKDDRSMKIVTTKSGLWTLISGWELDFCPKTGRVTFFSGLCAISWTINVDVDEWFHLALTADGKGNTALYFNGRIVGKSQYIKIYKFTGSLHVASSRTDCVLAGSVDEFVIFDTALTVSQIEIIKNNNCPSGVATKSAATTYKTTSTVKPPATTSQKPPATTSQKPAHTTKVVVPPTTKSTKPHKPCGLPWLYWSFDRNKNGKCTDDSGHKRHGSISGGWGSITDGKLRKGCKWSGKSVQHISLPSCELYSAFTVSLWLKIDSFSSGKSFVIATTKSSATDTLGWEVQFQASTKKIVFYAAGSSKAEWSVDVQAGVFFHVAVSVDNNKVKCHINGDDKGQKTVNACKKSTKSLTVAGRTSLNVQLEGTIDEFLLFDRVLDTEQVCSARDTYQTGHETSSWSRNTWDWDFGVDWERSSKFDSNSVNRLNNWWKWN